MIRKQRILDMIIEKLKHLVALLLISVMLPGCYNRSSSDSASVDFCHDGLMKEILEMVRLKYVEKPDEQKMREGAINGMLTALDPYSTYMNQETYELYMESTNGEFGGIGVEVLFLDNALRVISPIDDTPAAKAGLQYGDLIVKVDGEPVGSLSQIKLFKKLHGTPGSAIKLTIQRGNQDSFDLTLERAIITINPIKYKREGDIGYLRISYFNEKTTQMLRKAIENIQKEGPLSGAIIDLRNNPGGTLDQAISVTSLFINKGKIVEVKSRDAMKSMVYEAVGGEMLKDVPLIVLTNNGSASASEIMAGALKDYKRAIILGKTTMGKGSVQGLFSLEGRGAIKLTISHFYTPLGHEIHGKGITPDIVVESRPVIANLSYMNEEKQLIADDDQQLNRALDMLKGMALLKAR